MPNALIALLTFTVPAALVLGFVVTIHELGHFLVARACGVKVDVFSIGFGRPLLRRKDRSGVEWRVGWIPLGGYVKFAGDLNPASVPDQNELNQLKARMLREDGPQAVRSCYHFKPVWQRALIAAAGPAANFLLGIAVFTALYLAFGDPVFPATVRSVTPASAAAQAGFQVGDTVLKVDGRPIDGFDDLTGLVQLRAGVPMRFLVQRGADAVTLTATPVSTLDNDPYLGLQHIGRLGITGGGGKPIIRRYGVLGAVEHASGACWNMVASTGYYFKRLFAGQVPADQVGGIIGIAHAAGKVAQQTIQDGPTAGEIAADLTIKFFTLSALISVSVGLLNLLPVPMLDGGHLAFYAYEALARRPLSGRIQDASYRVGLALLVGFMLFAAWNDLQRFNMFHLFSRPIS